MCTSAFDDESYLVYCHIIFQIVPILHQYTKTHLPPPPQ